MGMDAGPMTQSQSQSHASMGSLQYTASGSAGMEAEQREAQLQQVSRPRRQAAAQVAVVHVKQVVQLHRRPAAAASAGGVLSGRVSRRRNSLSESEGIPKGDGEAANEEELQAVEEEEEYQEAQRDGDEEDAGMHAVDVEADVDDDVDLHAVSDAEDDDADDGMVVVGSEEVLPGQRRWAGCGGRGHT